MTPNLTTSLPNTLAVKDATFWMPEQASTFAGGPDAPLWGIDWLFYFILYVSVFFFVLIGFLMFFFSVKYRQKDRNDLPQGATHNTAVELAWTIPPLAIVLFIFGVGFVQYMDMVVPPNDAYVIDVEAKQWAWTFTYPNGAQSYDKLILPADQPVEFRLSSVDVLHSMYIPAFRMKRDCVPGRVHSVWAQPIGRENPSAEPASYRMYCTEYCGESHSNMNVDVLVYDDADALREKMASLGGAPEGATWIEWGAELYAQRGCSSCHGIDSDATQYPTWLNLVGSEREFEDGSTAIADYNYIVESIARPNARRVAGYSGKNMPAAQMTTPVYDALFAYMASISANYDVEPWMEGVPNPGEGLEPFMTRETWLAEQEEAAAGNSAEPEPETPAE